MQRKRLAETEHDTEVRKSSDRQHKTDVRAAETPIETTTRRAANKDQMKQARAAETTDETARRRAANKDQMKQTRAAETTDDTTRRRAANKDQMKQARAAETTDETARRRAADKDQTKQARAAETTDETARRRAANKDQMKQARAAETTDETARRRAANKDQTKQARAAETTDETARRRAANKDQTKQARDAETTGETARRKAADRNQKRQAREAATRQDSANRRAANRERMANKRAESSSHSSVDEAAAAFLATIKDGPIYGCVSCHRLMYKKSVVHYAERKFPCASPEVLCYISDHSNNLETDGQLWICCTCYSALKRGQMPTQCCYNGLALDDIPPELENLRPLEKRLISQRIAFMKLVGLPKGRQQAIHGPAVNVPTNLEHICAMLPRLPKDSEIVPVKLKRKLVYKGHHMYEYIRPQKVMDALLWLKDNNKFYDKIHVCDDWEDVWNTEDQALWEALTVEEEHSAETETGGNTNVTHGQPGPTSNLQPSMTKSAPNSYVQPRMRQRGISPENTVSHRLNEGPSGQLRTLATTHGFQIMDTPGDGNCFFHAVSMTMQDAGIQRLQHNEIRHNLIAFLQTSDQAQGYKNFLPGPEAAQQHTTTGMDIDHPTCSDAQIESIQDTTARQQARWEKYLERLQQGAWADNIAVQGVAEMLHINIRVLNTITPDYIINVQPASGPSEHTIHLGQIQQWHFVALKQSSNTNQQLREEEEAKEDEEEQRAFNLRSEQAGVPYDTLLQEEEQPDSDRIYSLAPGEHQRPCPVLSDENFEELAHPDKYPYGNGGFSTSRKKPITLRKYFNQRLLNCDGRFAKDLDYLLASQYAVEAKQVRDQVQIVLRQSRGHTFQGKTVSAGMLKNPNIIQAMLRTDTAFKFLKNVRGSPAYWHTALLDSLAMVRQLGTPTWFLTLSAADMQWPEVIQSIARQYGKELTPEDISNMAWEDKCMWLRSNPVTAARQFQYRMENFFKLFLCSKSSPIGKVKDYLIRVEFQARGSPHSHNILWVENAPEIDKATDDEVACFIDKYQHCSIPADDEELAALVQRLQTHVHSPTCRKHSQCRFNFPHPPSPKTLISRPPVNDDTSDIIQLHRTKRNTLAKVWEVMERPTTPEDARILELLHLAGVTPRDYMSALSTSKNGKHIILKRNFRERWINNYNPAILKTWKGNMDLQYITDPYSCIVYITSYMLKSERAMSELLRKVAQETNREEVKDQLKKLGTAFLNHREISAQEAAYRLLSLPLKQSSRKVTFVNTTPKDKRVSLMKPISAIVAMDDEDEGILCCSIVDRYCSKPHNMENTCLAEFAAKYSTGRQGATDDDDHDDDGALEDEEANALPDKISLLNGMGTMHRRRREAVIRFYKEKERGENFFRNLLMLYYPWRNEDVDLLAGHNTFEERYGVVAQVVEAARERYTCNAEAVDQAIHDLDQLGPPEHMWDQVAPGVQLQQEEQIREGEEQERPMDLDDSQNNIDMDAENNQRDRNELHARFDTEANKKAMTAEEYTSMMRSLNSKQKSFVMYHRKWCKDTVLALKAGKPIKPYRVFLSGPGGVGKSHVIRLVHHETSRLLKCVPGLYEPGDLAVILTAFTGTAAFNIDGMTLHSAFSLPIGKKQYLPLSNDKLNTMRSRLSKLKLLIVDEVSMVGADTLYHIHRRLQDIMKAGQDDTCFGDISILAVGDLFQLQPVRQGHVFDLPSDAYAKLYGSLWQENFQLFELTQTMRQRDDMAFAELLGRVRTASCTAEDIATLKSREILPSDPNYPAQALHVFKTNAEVDVHNEQHLMQLQNDGLPIVHIEAKDSKRDKQTEQVSNIPTPTKRAETGGLHTVLRLAVGARVMLTVNVDVSDGLSNGACGSVVGFDSKRNQVTAILVKFDHERVGSKARAASQYKRRNPEAVPIFKHEASFQVGRGRSVVQRTRQQFPLTLAWSCTIHKVQGITLDQIVVSMAGKGAFQPGQAYVALSRIRTLAGLHILGFNESAIRASPAVQEEMTRLQGHVIPCSDGGSDSLRQTSITEICFLNVRSYRRHLPDLKHERILQRATALCFVETFLRPIDHLSSGDLILPSCDVFRAERQPGENLDRGGIMIQARRPANPVEMDITVLGLEFKAITLQTCHGILNLIALYRRPLQSPTRFLSLLRQLIAAIDRTIPTIIVGDFNINLIESPEHPILTLMDDYGFHQMVAEPTTDSQSLLDHAYTDIPVSKMSITVQDCYYSDHDIVSLSMLI